MKRKSFAGSVLRIALAVVVGAPVLIYASLYLAQERLLFYPTALSETDASRLRSRYPGSEFTLETAPGVTLHGWLRRADTPGPLLIYFGGNAEEISWQLPLLNELPPGWSFLLTNYRGYGLSNGEPGEAELFQDALAIYDRFAPEFSGVAVMGWSLGSGVAVYLTSQRPVCGSILVSPYASVRALAEEIHPMLPVGWLLKHPFDSLSRAPKIKTPALFLIGEQDKVVPPPHSERLLAAWGGKVEKHRFARASHDDIVWENEYWPDVRGFLTALPQCNDALHPGPNAASHGLTPTGNPAS